MGFIILVVRGLNWELGFLGFRFSCVNSWLSGSFLFCVLFFFVVMDDFCSVFFIGLGLGSSKMILVGVVIGGF